MCDVVLHREDVLQLAVVGLRPQVRVGRRLNELRGDSNVLAGLAHAAFEDGRHVELLRDRRDVHILALEVERRGAGHHPQAADLRQHVQEFLGKTVGEVFLVLLRAQVRERQHRDRRHVLVDGRKQRLERRKCLRQIGMAELKHRFPACQILQAMFAERFERRTGGQPVATQIVRYLGQQRLSAVSDRKKPRHMVERRTEIVAVAHFRRPRV